MSQTVVSAFDYASLDSDTAQFLQQQTGEIRSLMRRTTQDILEIGQKLLEVKKILGHGRFLDWLEAEFAWTNRTAERFMKVAEQFGSKFDIMSNLDFAPTALYTLASPSTPSSARAEALARAKEGEPITAKTAQLIKQKHLSTPIPQESQPKGKPIEVVSIRKASDKLWTQLGSQWLFRGHPTSPDFLSRLPDEIALWLNFSAHQSDWGVTGDKSIKSGVSMLTTGALESEDLRFFKALFDNTMKLYTEEKDAVVIGFLPLPELLLDVEKWGCRCFVAEPDPLRHQIAIATWQKHSQPLPKSQN